MTENQRDVMEYEVAIVGAGPAGLACAIRLKQLNPELSVCVLEKAASLGAHSLSGAVMEPGPLDELLPRWREHAPAICVPAARDEFLYLTRRKRYRLPIIPPQMVNHGNFIISLGQLIPILGAEAEKLGVDVFAGFAASEALFDDSGAVKGVRIGDMGVQKNGERGPNFALGPEIHAKITMLCEGCRGSTSKQLIRRFKLDAGKSPQTYGLGFKELWQLPPGRVQPGLIQHTVGLAARPPHLRRKFSLSPRQRSRVRGLRGGLGLRGSAVQALRSLSAVQEPPADQGAAARRGDHRRRCAHRDRGRLSIHADARDARGDAGRRCGRHPQHAEDQGHSPGDTFRHDRRRALHRERHELGFDRRWRESAGGRELYKVRNIRPGFNRGLWFGLANAALETITFGKLPWTLANHADDKALKRLDEYASPDRGWGERELPPRDRLAFVFFASTTHDENQPVHLHVADTALCATRCVGEFGNPCTNFCPANVYEMIADGSGGTKLQINASNCVHCKACDIKEPYPDQITWVPPEGGSGPNYQSL